MLDEKKVELVGLGQSLKEQFSVRPDGNYQYDPQSMTLYEFIPVPAGADVPVESMPR